MSISSRDMLVVLKSAKFNKKSDIRSGPVPGLLSEEG